MSSESGRKRIADALQGLPPEASPEEAVERAVFLARIDAGLAELNAGEGFSHEEVRSRLGL